MAKQISQARVPVEIAALIPIGTPDLDSSKGAEAIGANLADLGAELHKTRIARELAEGVSQYNDGMDDYIKSLNPVDEDPVDPGEYLTGYDKVIAKQQSSIFKGKSREAQEILKNRFVIWDQTNKAKLASAAIERHHELQFDRLGDAMITMARNGNQTREEAELLLAQSSAGFDERQKLIAIYDKEAERYFTNAKLAVIMDGAKSLVDPTETSEAKRAKNLDKMLDYIESQGLKANLTTTQISWMKTSATADHDREQSVLDAQHKQLLEGISDGIAIGEIGPLDIFGNPNISGPEKTQKLAEYKAFSTATIPEVSDFDAVDRVKAANEAFATGKQNKEFARNVLKNEFSKLDAADRKKYRNEIYEKQDKVFAQRRSDGRFFLKNALLTEQTVFGLTFKPGTEEKQNYENASVEMENLLEQYQEAKKWPTNMEFYAEVQAIATKVKGSAYTIGDPKGLNYLQDISDENLRKAAEAAKNIVGPAEHKPYAPAKDPVFKVNSSGKPDKDTYEYNTDGEEIGVKFDGGVIKIDGTYYKDGWEWKYRGNGRSDKVGPAPVRRRR